MTRSILNASLKQAHCSDFCLLHVCSKTCSVRWSTQLRDQLVSSDSRLLHACSRVVSFVPIAFDRHCLVRVYYTHVVELVSFVDQLNQEINYWLVIVADSLSNVSFKQTSYRVIDSIKKSILNASLKQTHCRFVPFKQASYRVTDSTTRSILVCHCSRLTSDSCLQRVAELVLFIDRLNDEINIRRALEAELVLIASIAFNNALCFCLSHSIELVSISAYRVR